MRAGYGGNALLGVWGRHKGTHFHQKNFPIVCAHAKSARYARERAAQRFLPYRGKKRNISPASALTSDPDEMLRFAWKPMEP